MFREIASFEVRFHLRQPLIYISIGIFFLLTFLAITTDSVQIGGSIGNVNRNAPFVIMQIMLIMSALGVFVTTAFVANAVNRDFELGTESLFFSTPMSKLAYLGGRFTGAFGISLLVFASVAAAIIVGSFMPWLEPERIGPFLSIPYLWAFFVLVLPNVFLTAAIFFSLAASTRSMLYTYVGVAGFFVAYTVSQAFIQDIDSEKIASLADPFGFAAFFITTKYWTVFERNTMVPPLSGLLLANRLLWMAVGAAILAFAFTRFRFAISGTGSGKKRKGTSPAAQDTLMTRVALPESATPPVARDFSAVGQLRQFLYQTRIELGGIIRSVPFAILVLLGVLNTIGNAFGQQQMYDTGTWPMTGAMLRVIASAFVLYLFIIIVFYAGELVWRERSLRLAGVYDALPVPDWVFWGAKLTALVVIIELLFAIAGLTTIGFQLGKGYSNLEPGLYFEGLFYQGAWAFLLTAILAFFLQAALNNKYLGFLVMTALFVLFFAMPSMDFEHVLYRYGIAPPRPYSDMNGYGHFASGLFWTNIYWTFFAAALLLAAHLLWVRGTETSARWRAILARRRFGTAATAVSAIALAGFLGTGAWVFYNTNVINEYRTTKQREGQQAAYEKSYKKYQRLPQPRIVSAKADVDIFPERRAADIRGRYEIRNKTAAPISVLHVTINPLVKINSLTIVGGKMRTPDEDNGYYIYDLAPAMQPGEQRTLAFDLAVRNEGFTHDRGNVDFVYNGTFFNNFSYFPHVGYQPIAELDDNNKRRKNGLGPVARMPKLGDPWALGQTYLTGESDWLDFETTVSTSPDQIALAPGYLQREWTENGRRYFHYKMDAPILGFWSYLSARYTVRRDTWNDVAIEVYYHEPHSYNVDRMIDGVKKSLDYFTKNFGPYQHRQVRILEFPRYATFAQSFPNTIPYSEGIGFVARLDDPEAIDYVFYVTAHEVAHQWWAHQVIGANMQGATVLSETLSQYSALMVMEKEYGKDKMQKFLKYELDRYLSARGGELVEEMPLELVENQGYIHYRKGSLVMYALRDYMGEEALNRALAKFVADHKFAEPPYPTSRDLLAYIRAEASPELQPVISDLFEKITIYENKASIATATKRADGKWVVAMEVEAGKFYATGGGKEEGVKIGDLIDIGVLGPAPKDETSSAPILYLEKKRIDQPKMTFEVVVDSEPAKAGIDPLNKLIDRNPEDNLKTVEKK